MTGPVATVEQSLAKQRAQKPLYAMRERALTALNPAVDLAAVKGNEREVFSRARATLRADPDAKLTEELRP
jgi:hypothetical protein